MKATEVTAGPAENNGSLLPGLWRDSLHVTCGLTACTQGSAPGPTLGNEHGKTLPYFTFFVLSRAPHAAAADKRKSTPLGPPVASSHSPAATVHVIQDGGRQVRCARLSGDAGGGGCDPWRELGEVERLELEDAGDELMASLVRHAARLPRLDALSVTWTPMKVSDALRSRFRCTGLLRVHFCNQFVVKRYSSAWQRHLACRYSTVDSLK